MKRAPGYWIAPLVVLLGVPVVLLAAQLTTTVLSVEGMT